MSDGRVRFSQTDGVASVVFDRPGARNAMTWGMYQQLAAACERIASDPAIRVATLRGAGGEAFVAGTDIAQFQAFTSAEDGVAYEQRIDAAIEQIERLAVPTIAVVEGWAMGGGLAIATACDLRVATPTARFGVPIARTVGNCLSIANTARLLSAFGQACTKRLLLLAETITAEEAASLGFVNRVVAPEKLDAEVDALCERLKSHAPLTMRIAKEAIRRVLLADLPEGEDLIREVYGSADFKTGVAAFLAKKTPKWRGR
jgi:enoyl-CoA hydratase